MNSELRAIADALNCHADLRVAIAFGSVARDEAGPSSDLDIAILARKPLTAAKRLGLIDELAAISGRPVDLLDLYGLHGPVLTRLILEGVELLRRDAAALAELRLRALYDDADFMPYRRRILDERQRQWTAS